MRRLLLAFALCAVTAAGASAPSAQAITTVCGNADTSHHAMQPIRAGGELIGRLWIWSTRDHRSCAVLRAVKWKGTPHYMFVQVCAKQTGPRKATGCTGYDAGAYRYYAGPVYHPQQYCQTVHVKVDVPGGKRVVDRFIGGPCD